MSDKGMSESMAKLDALLFVTLPTLSMLNSLQKQLSDLRRINELQAEQVSIQKQRYELIMRPTA